MFDVWEFGQGVDGHGEEEGFVGFAFQVVQFFGEVHGAGAVFQVDVFQTDAGGKGGVLAISIGFEHFGDGGLGGAVAGFDFDVHWQDVEAVFAGFVVGEGGFFFCGNGGGRGGRYHVFIGRLGYHVAAAAGEGQGDENGGG